MIRQIQIDLKSWILANEVSNNQAIMQAHPLIVQCGLLPSQPQQKSSCWVVPHVTKILQNLTHPDPIYPTPLLGLDMTQGHFLSGV